MNELDESFELTSDQLKSIVDLTQKIICIISEAGDGIVVLRSLSSALTFVVCNGPETQEEAENAVEFFVASVGEAIENADTYGIARWSRGTAH